MPHPSFSDSVKSLNSQFWLLMAAAEHLTFVGTALAHANRRDHAAVLSGVLFGAPKHGHHIRVRNHSIAADLSKLAGDCVAWLPGYFIILAKSTAEGHLVQELQSTVDTDTGVAEALDRWRSLNRGAKRPTRKQAIESVVQRAVRGSYNDLDRVVSLTGFRTALDGVSRRLEDYSRTRNKLAHQLSPTGEPPSQTAKDFAQYLEGLSTAVRLIEAALKK
jgi:hypothetical protein